MLKYFNKICMLSEIKEGQKRFRFTALYSFSPDATLILTAFFSGVSPGEVPERRFSRFISLLLGSLKVRFSSLMLAWCFSSMSSDLSRNYRVKQIRQEDFIFTGLWVRISGKATDKETVKTNRWTTTSVLRCVTYKVVGIENFSHPCQTRYQMWSDFMSAEQRQKWEINCSVPHTQPYNCSDKQNRTQVLYFPPVFALFVSQPH